MYAIIVTGGKQYLVTEGQKLQVEKLELAVGATLNLDCLLVSDDSGESVKVGTPLVAGGQVTAKVVAQDRADKVSVIKYKRKVRYRRNVGHRQPFTEILIEKIV
jgi:large subunit ribosomal protein L21